MAFFPNEFIQSVIERNDIVDVITASGVQVKGSGSSLKALCPFHGDKNTPSLAISKDKQLFHCFGCGKGGTVLNFIMEREGLDFVEAVKFLAERSGLDIPESKGNEREEAIKSDLKQVLYAINIEAAKYFREKLYSPVGKVALDYASKRELDEKTIKRFGLGYAPANRELLDILKDKGYTSEQLRLAGITGEGDDGSEYLRFRDRLMFPIIDLRKNVIAFGGRALGDGQPKYLNTSQTPIFNKSYNLFALNFAKNSKTNYLVLVEGYMDVVMLHKHGIDSAVATLGTALTEQQARLIRRYREESVISYDSDEAGQAASRRAIEILNQAGVKARVLQQNDCKDPDEYIKKHGAGAFLNLIDKSPVAIEYLHEKLKDKYDLSTSEGKLMYARGIAAELAKIESSVEREIYGRKVAEEAGISYEAVFSEIEREMRVQKARKVNLVPGSTPKKERMQKAESPTKTLIALMSQDVLAVDIAKKSLEVSDFEGIWRDLAEEFFAGKTAREIAQNSKFAEKMTQISDALLGNDTIDDVRMAAEELVARIKRENRMTAMLKAAEAGNVDRIKELQKE